MKNLKIASAIGFLILIALVWFVGPYAGLEAPETRFGWVFCIMLVWVLSLLVGHLVARRAGGLIEKMLQRQADEAVIGASPDKRAEVNLLRQRLLSAIDTLKSSRLGKSRGSAALYELPWYMIIGHPAAGKSTAILQSGLTFPFSDKNGVQGVGGTRNCDWFFSTEGVLLDTAGRYATQSDDRVEWLSFLKLLKRYRAKAPVNGILVAISLPELAQFNSEGFTVYARQIRERIHEIEDTFSLQVPIYLIFTKLDLLGGFSQFFEDGSDEERNRVWGVTLPHEQGAGYNVTHVVSLQFEMLFQGLRAMGEEKLAGSSVEQARPALFAFPIEFHTLRDGICKFVELLQEDDPYHARPLLRGLYFSSALQQGVPRIGAATRVAGVFDLARKGFDLGPGQSSYSYFLRDLFREVIFPDQHLITRQTRKGGSRWRLVGMLCGLTLLATLSGAMTWSYIGNQKTIAAIQADRDKARTLAESGQLYDSLQSMLLLQTRLEQLEKYREQGYPWQLGFGMYRGAKIEPALRKEYFDALQKVMLQPVKHDLEMTLQQLGSVAPEPAPAVAPPPPPVHVTHAAPPVAPRKTPHHRHIKSGLPSIDLGFSESIQRATGLKSVRVQPALSAPSSVTHKSDSALKLESGYNALKAYLMLHDASRMDAAHLSDEIPRHWRSWLEANKGNQSFETIYPMAERLVSFYISQIKEPDLPLIDNDARIVAAARDVLRGSLRQMSATERVYNELKARANVRYEPISVSRILNGKDSDLVASSYMVPGAFTRDAWEKYMQAAIVDASKGDIKSDDWVLASSMQDNLGRDGDLEKIRTEMVSLYSADYASAWKQFLQGIVVKDINGLPNAVDALSRLSDKQSSPIKKIFVRVAYETSWDNPSQLQNKLANAKSSLLDKTTELLEGKTDAPTDSSASNFGPTGRQFVFIGTLGGNNGAALDGYLDQLGKLKARLAQLVSNDPAGVATAARQLMQSTLNGTPSEFTDSLQFVDNSLLSQADPSEKDTIRPLLVRPLMQTYSLLLPPVVNDINEAWRQGPYEQWKQLASKYPFSQTQNEATIGDISLFIKPGDGTLNQFLDKYLNGLLSRNGDEFSARAWANMGIKFNPDFLSGITKLTALGSSLLRDGDVAKFQLQPVPTPGLSEITMEIDGQPIRYRNGPQPWQDFTWPNPSSNSLGARIQVVAFNGATTVVANQQGRMGWIRLLSQAQTESASVPTNQLVWVDKTNPNGSAVTFNYRHVSGLNPMQLSSKQHFNLPERVTE